MDLPSHEENFVDREEIKRGSSGDGSRGPELVKNYSSKTTEICWVHH